MSMPLVVAAAAGGVAAPAYASGARHEGKTRSGARAHGERILRRGSAGPDVVRIQLLLGIPADGIFGRQTDRAVRSFQRAHGLLVDGQVGPQTRGALTAGQSAAGGLILRAGDQGAPVAVVQHALGISADGEFGRQTLAAVRSFQARHGLLVDGQVGPHTAAALRVRLSGTVRHHAVPLGSASHHGHAHHAAAFHATSMILRAGDKGAPVAVVQHALGVGADGEFGPQTLAAVRSFQARHGLLVDGQVGPNTATALHVRLTGSVRHHAVAFPHSHQSSVTTSHVTASSVGAQAAALARHYLGVPYRWGGSSPSGFDCSGLVYYVYGRLGVHLPRVTYSQWDAGPHIARNDLRPGDLVFFYGHGHVGMYLGGGLFIHAPHTGTVVQITSLSGWYADHYDGAVRPA
jgi:cell wall-associated NlpC family hydrolase